jgi:hypothetical protein
MKSQSIISITDQQKFVDFLISLAPDGETPLLARQKPKLVDGKVALHADGAVKAVWPAMLPTVKIKPDWAIYANTGSFIKDRFKNTPSASRDNCEYVLVMVLDDVGDPEKAPNVPPLQPTWKMETSEGSFQWGYVFSDQPTANDFSAAIRAVADAGYTDPGACNPVRNFRIPGSINIKPNKNGFAARLVEFTPTVEYTLEEICTALNVVPAPADSTAYSPIRLTDTGQDDIATWLSDQNMVLSKPNAQGWMGVICPNSESHTDGNPEGRYNPSMRAYTCLHSHCVDFSSRVFLDWCADQGAPKHEQGFRDELIADLHAKTLSKLTPNARFPDVAADIVADINRKEAGRLTRAEWYSRYAYNQDDDSYFDLENRSEMSRSSFNATYRHINCTSVHNTKRRIEASVSFDENRQDLGAPAIRGVTYAAGEDRLLTRGGHVYGNMWRNLRPTLKSGDVTKWLNHCKRLVPNDAEREHMFDVMACKLQRPRVKVNHAILLSGFEGSGKDSFFAPLFYGIRGDGRVNPENVRTMPAHKALETFHYELETEVLVLNELRESDARERRALANSLKPLIAAPPDMITINRKGLKPYQMVNKLLVVAFSNYRVSITLDSGDRRWFCVWSDAPKMTPEEGADLWSWFEDGGLSASADWLAQRDISKFNPSSAPFMTEFKRSMIQDGMSTAEEYLHDLMSNERGQFARGVISAPFHELRGLLEYSCPVQGTKIHQQALLHALNEAGWQDMGRLGSARASAVKRIFASPRIVQSGLSKSEIRDLVDQPLNTVNGNNDSALGDVMPDNILQLRKH